MGVPPKERLLLFSGTLVRIPHTNLYDQHRGAASCRSDQSSRWRQVSDRAVRTTGNESNQQQENTLTKCFIST